MPQIRLERPEDTEAIREVLLAAFGREGEARLVERLRASGSMVRALVASVLGLYTQGDFHNQPAPAAEVRS